MDFLSFLKKQAKRQDQYKASMAAKNHKIVNLEQQPYQLYCEACSKR
jgi:hypothetical protein